MRILLVRHADAGDAEVFAKEGMPDEFRPLSPKGRRQMKKVARALKALVPRVEQTATSPYERALETAAFLRNVYSSSAYEETAALEPERAPEQIAGWLGAKKISGVAIIVGHEPHLGNFLEWCVTGTNTNAIELKKAGAALVEFEQSPAKGKGALLWMMGPKELAMIRKRR